MTCGAALKTKHILASYNIYSYLRHFGVSLPEQLRNEKGKLKIKDSASLFFPTVFFHLLFSIFCFLLPYCSWCMLLWHEGPGWLYGFDVSHCTGPLSSRAWCSQRSPPLFCLLQHASVDLQACLWCSVSSSQLNLHPARVPQPLVFFSCIFKALCTILAWC